MNNTNARSRPAVTGSALLMLALLTGCFGYVDGGYVGYGGPVIVPGPDLFFWGGDYGRGRDVRFDSHRGAVSRGAAHGGGGHGGGGRR